MENTDNSFYSNPGNNTFLNNFLSQFESQPEIGLAILKSDQECKEILNLLLISEYKYFSDAKDAVRMLKAGKKIVFEITENFSKSEYDFIVQYANSPGLVQVIDTDTFKAELHEFDIEKAKFLIIASEENIKKLEMKYPIRDKAGLIFRL